MSKAEEFIESYTRKCSNEIDQLGADIAAFSEYHPWLTPDQARRAVEIAREEIYEWLSVNFFNYFAARCSMLDMFLEDLKQAMKDE